MAEHGPDTPRVPGRISTGVPGLDEVLCGGLTPDRLYLLEGTPGTGKTTLSLQYLLDGAARGERGLYVTLSETEDELRSAAASHGWSLDGIEIYELVNELGLDPDSEQSILHPSEIELGETVKDVIARVDDLKPARLVFDSLSELRLLAQNPLRYRRQILALKQFFAKRACTVLMLDDRTSEAGDVQLHSIAHGVISLEQSPREFGSERRRLRIIKMRGIKFRGGYHDFVLDTGGLRVFPRLIAAEHHARFDSTCCLAAAWCPAPTPCCSVPRGPERPRRPSDACSPPWSEERRRPTSCSTRGLRPCSPAPPCSAWTWLPTSRRAG